MAEENKSVVNWPGKSGEYKVVQLRLDGKPYLRFQSDCEIIHGAMLENFLRAQSIDYQTFRTDKDQTLPEARGERYVVDGMGEADVDVKRRRASFHGSSHDYGISINPKHLEEIKQLEPDWKIEV